jgi:hypothetical protein
MTPGLCIAEDTFFPWQYFLTNFVTIINPAFIFGMVHAWVGQKLLKNYIFKSFYDISKLSSGHHFNKYKSNRLPLLHK